MKTKQMWLLAEIGIALLSLAIAGAMMVVIDSHTEVNLWFDIPCGLIIALWYDRSISRWFYSGVSEEEKKRIVNDKE